MDFYSDDAWGNPQKQEAWHPAIAPATAEDGNSDPDYLNDVYMGHDTHGLLAMSKEAADGLGQFGPKTSSVMAEGNTFAPHPHPHPHQYGQNPNTATTGTRPGYTMNIGHHFEDVFTGLPGDAQPDGQPHPATFYGHECDDEHCDPSTVCHDTNCPSPADCDDCSSPYTPCQDPDCSTECDDQACNPDTRCTDTHCPATEQLPQDGQMFNQNDPNAADAAHALKSLGEVHDVPYGHHHLYTSPIPTQSMPGSQYPYMFNPAESWNDFQFCMSNLDYHGFQSHFASGPHNGVPDLSTPAPSPRFQQPIQQAPGPVTPDLSFPHPQGGVSMSRTSSLSSTGNTSMTGNHSGPVARAGYGTAHTTPMEGSPSLHHHHHRCWWGDCEFVGVTPEVLHEHCLEHIKCVDKTSEGFPCLWKDCNRAANHRRNFQQKSKLQRHLQVHTEYKPFKCPECDMRLSAKQALEQHMRTHTGEKPFVCKEPGCGYACRQQSAFTMHMRGHRGEKPLSCPICMKPFSESSNLSKHKKTHENTGKNECRFCPNSYHRSDQLRRHLRKKHQSELAKEEAGFIENILGLSAPSSG